MSVRYRTLALFADAGTRAASLHVTALDSSQTWVRRRWCRMIASSAAPAARTTDKRWTGSARSSVASGRALKYMLTSAAPSPKHVTCNARETAWAVTALRRRETI